MEVVEGTHSLILRKVGVACVLIVTDIKVKGRNNLKGLVPPPSNLSLL